jgi:2-oxoglutarate ferredoxin oxidoreductase subunit delta
VTEAASQKTAKADVVVDLELCKACGICIALCPTKVFDADDGGRAVAARLEDCTVCRLCEWHCPDFAIEVVARAKDS